MRICSCEKPVYVLSPHTGEIIATPCGSCDSCRNQRAKRWIDRLSQECKQHKYSYMVNLTYDDESLPKLMFCEEDVDYLEFVNRTSERIPLEELVELCKDEYGEYLVEDLKYLRDRLAHPLGLPCIFTKDISNFFKRFNKYCFSHVTFHYENIRYFCCHEYGPSTFRCHSHMLVWFDDDHLFPGHIRKQSQALHYLRDFLQSIFSAFPHHRNGHSLLRLRIRSFRILQGSC